MSSFITRLFTTPMGLATLITGAAMVIFMGAGSTLHRQDIFAQSSSYDKRNSTEIALAANERNSAGYGPVSISQVTPNKKTK